MGGYHWANAENKPRYLIAPSAKCDLHFLFCLSLPPTLGWSDQVYQAENLSSFKARGHHTRSPEGHESVLLLVILPPLSTFTFIPNSHPLNLHTLIPPFRGCFLEIMAATNLTATHPTGNMVPAAAPISSEEIGEYEKILKLSEEIFSGSHPRLKVAQKFVRKPKTQPSEDSPTAQQPPKNQFERPAAQLSGPGYAPNPPTWDPTPTRVVPRPASDIDPLFLTKPDHLVKAELQLHRKRMERTLRDQWEQSKREAKQRPSLQDTKPDFDVSEVLDKAHTIVKPVAVEPVIDVDPRPSLDDSYYSSKAPDSPPGMEDQEIPPQAIPTGPSSARVPAAPVEQYTDELQRLEDLNRTGSDQEMQDAYSVADQHIPHPQKQVHSRQKETAPRFHESQQADNVEEPEYSPPSPVAPPVDHRTYQQLPAHNQTRQPYTERVREMPSGDNITVVRNHITSPAAPLPSRVSPLAMAKVPSVQQVRDDRFEHGVIRVDSDPESGRASPSGPVPQIGSRKRRKIQEREQDGHGVSYKQSNADHSVPYIKEEPVSPPPFTDDFLVTHSRRPAQHPVYIDIESPQYTPNAERHEPTSRAPVYESASYHESPVEQRMARPLSRVGTARPVRDNTDLRRVASLQYARQPEYHDGYIERDPHLARSASYTVMDRRLPEQPRYYEDVSYGPRYVQVNPAPQQVYGDQYYDEQPPQAMPPPPRRYVIDEHGNEYEMVPSRRTQTMAPPSRPASRAPAPQGEIYDDRHVRTASVRAPSVVQDPYVERRYVQEMPPPQPVYRRVPSQYAPVASDRQLYVTPMEHEQYSRAGSMQVEYLPGRPTYVEEQQMPQEGVIRTSSVRPQAQHRYEEPQVIQHVSGAHPAASVRASSVYLNDRPMSQYVERPYHMRERGGYYEDRVVLEGPSETVHRVPQRYQGP